MNGAGSTFRSLPSPGDGPPAVSGCWVAVYIDGIQVYAPVAVQRVAGRAVAGGGGTPAPDFSTMPVNEFAAAEFYPHLSSTPQQFTAMGDLDCGVLVLWTRER